MGDKMDFDFPFDQWEEIFPIFDKVLMAEDAFGVIFPRFMKPVHIQLPYKAIYFFMSEIFWQHNLLELVCVLDYELSASNTPINYLGIFLILSFKKFVR